jgi:hypothetical protein
MKSGAFLLCGHPRHGVLEFQPAILEPPTSKCAVEIASLVNLANRILDERARFGGVFSGDDDREEINDILRVGTSAGGARAKAILAWNPATNEFRSGQVSAQTYDPFCETKQHPIGGSGEPLKILRFWKVVY